MELVYMNCSSAVEMILILFEGGGTGPWGAEVKMGLLADQSGAGSMPGLAARLKYDWMLWLPAMVKSSC